MNENHCPREAELLKFVDFDLSPEQLRRIEGHLETCSVCSKQVTALRTLIADVAAPPADRLEVAEHVGAVLARLDEPKRAAPTSRMFVLAGVLAAAAALVLVVFVERAQTAAQPQFAARGNAAEASLARDVGVRLYAQGDSLRPLETGRRVAVGVALTAGLKNLGANPAHVLLFAIDAAQTVHWIAPKYLSAASDPESVPIVPSSTEQLLPTAVVFDDLVQGPLHVIALVTQEPHRVSEIESLAPGELNTEALAKRFERASVRQVVLEVTP